MNYPPPLVKVKLYAHQREAYEKALETFDSGKSRGYGLLFECGCGKTITAIAVAGQLFRTQKVRRVLIVAPLSILSVWQDEFEKFAVFPYVLTVLEGSGAKKANTLHHLKSEDMTVVVVNYESTWRLESEILTWKPDLIIADEGHKLKGYRTKVSKCMHRLSDAANYRLLLTGTLVTNHAEDVWSPYRFLEKNVFGNTGYYAWRGRYMDAYGYGNHQYRLKKSMEPEYTEKLHSIAYRIRKEDALDLPETTDIVRRVKLEPGAAKLYAALVKECYAELENGEISVTNVLTKILRLSQLTGGHITDDSGKSTAVSTAKLDCLAELIETLREDGKKAVVIAKFTAEINAIKKLLEKMGVSYSAITGETKDRAEQVRLFQSGDNAVFIGQIACASVGLTLHAASDLIFYSLDYSTANHEQARSRIHRSGQSNSCSYYYIQAHGTIDEQVLRALREKSDFARRVTDEYRRSMNPF